MISLPFSYSPFRPNGTFAKTKTRMHFGEKLRKIPTHALIVDPVVNTSSTNKIFFPFNDFAAAVGASALLIFFRSAFDKSLCFTFLVLIKARQNPLPMPAKIKGI